MFLFLDPKVVVSVLKSDAQQKLLIFLIDKKHLQRKSIVIQRLCNDSDILLTVCFVSAQVILVQVNPGETFTIRGEDGSLQCIQGQFCISLL